MRIISSTGGCSRQYSGGNVTENVVHQVAWIQSALDLPLPSAATMSGGVFRRRTAERCRDTIALTTGISERYRRHLAIHVSATAATGWANAYWAATAPLSMSRLE